MKRLKSFSIVFILLVIACTMSSCKKTIVVPESVSVSGVTLNSESLQLTVGESRVLTATVSPYNASNKKVLWSTSNASVAEVSSDGIVMALETGSSTIKVTTDDGAKTAECKLTVKAKAVCVTSVKLNSSTLNLTEGDIAKLTATVYPDDATNKNVTWTSSNTSVATVSDGTVKALKTGTATIKVTTADGNKSAECRVTVKAKAVSVTSVKLNSSTLTLTEGDNEKLTATVYPNDATNKNVTWTSSNTSVATVSDGTVKAMKKGTATIKVTTTDGGKTAECKVTVNAKVVSVESVKLNKSTLTLTEGDIEKLTATVYPDDATNKNVTWTSSNTSVATVSDGTVKALKKGTATIKVTTVDGAKAVECQVTVKAKTISVESVRLNKSTLTLTEGGSETLSATVYPDNASNRNVTWTSSNPSVATVNNGTVNALSAGTTTIKVITADGAKTAACQVTVKRKDFNSGHEGTGEKEW